MVLVNGSEGIGTGWSSYVPNYNPLDIIANIRHMLNDEPVEPMQPWYKGFIGSIEKTATKEACCTYTVSGIIEEVDDTTLRITELPIRKWTQDYKEYLESVSAENDKSKDPFIEVHHCTFELVYIGIEIFAGNLITVLYRDAGITVEERLCISQCVCHLSSFRQQRQRVC